MSRALLAATLLSLLRVSPAAAAQAPAAPAPAGPALERLADALAAELRLRHPEPPLALHVSAPAAPLARALATLLAARLPGLAPVVLEAPTPEVAEALARERGLRSLARVALALEQGELRARGDLLGTWVNFWSGLTPTRPAGPAAALAQAVPADAAALALAAAGAAPPTAGPRAPLRLLGAALAQLPGRTGALAAGDLDGDGHDEVAALLRLPTGEEEVVVLDGAGRVRARRSLQALAPSATPTREPFGTLAFQDAPRRLLVRSAGRASGEALVLGAGPDGAAALLPQARLEGPAPVSAQARAPLVEGRALLGPELQWGEGLRAAAPFVTAAFGRAGRGGAESLLLVFPEGAGSLYPQPGAAPVALGALGAASALADVDGDGALEVLTTEAQVAPAPERLRVLGARGGAPLWAGELPRGRALQLAAARLDAGATQQVLVACWLEDGTTELSLFRQVTP